MRLRYYSLFISSIGLLLSGSASAGRVLEYIRSQDLNDYALGLAVSIKQSPYAGADNSSYAYPYLTSFRDSSFTDDWLVVKEGDLGLRWVKNGWEVGLLGRIQTLGQGDSQAPELEGLEQRQWGVELAPMIGWRGWPVHINFKPYTEITGNHSGTISQLRFSWPYEWERGYIIPAIELNYQSEEYANYYYGVSASESSPLREEYQLDASLNTALKLRLGYELSDSWLLSANIAYEFLDSNIVDSPIVGQDALWSTSIGLAYNSDVFQSRDAPHLRAKQARVEFKVGIFNDSVESTIWHTSSADGVESEVELGDTLGLSGQETVLQYDALFRIANYHQIDIGYFEFERSSSISLNTPVNYSNETFASDTRVESKINSKIFQVSYSYFLIKDTQKEVAVMAGIHFSRFKTEISSAVTGQKVSSNHAAPLPVIGLQGGVSLGQKLSLRARLELFRLEFASYEGRMNHLSLDLRREMTESFSVGLGYNLYTLKLDAHDASKGSLEVRHKGPLLFFNVSF